MLPLAAGGHRPPPASAPRRRCTCARVGAAWGGRPEGRRRRSFGTPPHHLAAASGTQWPPRRPMGQKPPIGHTPSRLPRRGVARVRAGAAEAARCRRRAPAAATPTAARWGHGGAAGAGAERHANERDAGLSSCVKDVGARGDRVGGGRSPLRSPCWSAVHSRGLRREDCARARLYGAPVVAALWCG